MLNDASRKGRSPSRRRKPGLALVAATVAGLALAGPGSAQLGPTQSQSGSDGTLQAVVTNVQITKNAVQAPVQVDAPVRVLSPGSNSGGGNTGAEAGGGGGGGGGTAGQSQSGGNGAAQAGVTNVQVGDSTLQAPVRIDAPIRVLSPGENRGGAQATATTDGGGGSARQSQNGENGALQALLSSIQVTGMTVQTPIGLYAPVRILSPGDDAGGTRASADAGGGGSGATQSQNGESGAAQAGVTNAQVAGNDVQAPVAATAPVRVLSPRDGTAGNGGGSGNGGGVADDGAGSPGGNLGAGAGEARAGSIVETLAAVARDTTLPLTGAPLTLLVLAGLALVLTGARLRASATRAVR